MNVNGGWWFNMMSGKLLARVVGQTKTASKGKLYPLLYLPVLLAQSLIVVWYILAVSVL